MDNFEKISTWKIKRKIERYDTLLDRFVNIMFIGSILLIWIINGLTNY